jgi:spermidine/putrescine transport system permease protein
VPFPESGSGVFIAMVYAYVLFMVFPLYNVLETLDMNQVEATRDLGASTWNLHRRVVIPHARPGIAVGCVMTFMLSAGSYAVPHIMTRGTASS